MESEQDYADRIQAQMRALDARIDEVEAAARARNASDQMNEVSGLRRVRDRVRQHLADVKQHTQDDWQTTRSELEGEWNEFRRSVSDAHSRYVAWDEAREQRFNAHLDEADAALRRSAAEDAVVAAGVKARVSEARNDLKEKTAQARRTYDTWRKHREDEKLLRTLDESELELDEAFDRFSAAIDSVQRGSRPRAD
jgi:hypothetical protein